MIKVTRLDKREMVINADLIETIEATPDTIITLVTGKKILVRDTVDEVVEKIVKYREKVMPIIVRPIEYQTQETQS